jgi:hypothetical protein
MTLLKDLQVNFAFMLSLGEEFKMFQQAPQVHTIKPATLFAEVVA